MFGAQIVAERGMLADGSLNRYADSLSVHLRSIILGLGLTGVEEIIIGDAVHIDSIPQSSIGEYLAW